MTALLTRGFRRIVIVGAGLGGLAAACHLSGAGHRVTVVEQASGPGGQISRVVRDGFTFDTGPAAFCASDLLEATFAAAGTRMSDLLTLRPLEASFRACFSDGSTIHVRAGTEAMAAEIRELCGAREAQAYVRFGRWLETVRELVRQHRPEQTLRPTSLLQLAGAGAFRRFDDTLRRHFQDERLVRLLGFPLTQVGLDPRRTRTATAVMALPPLTDSLCYPEGGVAAVPAALAEAAEKAGATFRYGVKAQQVRSTTSGRVRAVRLADGAEIPADVVVVNADPATAYDTLLPSLTMPAAVRRARHARSMYVWHVGVRGRPPGGVQHVNVHLKGRSGAHVEDSSHDQLQSQAGLALDDVPVLVNVPTISDPRLAPAGSSVMSVYVPVPNLSAHIDWTVERTKARERLRALLERWGYPTEVVTEQIVDPTAWAQEGMAMGTPFARTAGWLGHTPDVDRRMPGLIFTGAGTSQGPGITGALLSGKAAAHLALAG